VVNGACWNHDRADAAQHLLFTPPAAVCGPHDAALAPLQAASGAKVTVWSTPQWINELDTALQVRG